MGRWLACFVIGYGVVSSPAIAEPLQELDGVRRVCRSGVDSAVARAHQARGEAGVVAAEVLPNPVLVVEHQRSLTGAIDRETLLGMAIPFGIGGRRWVQQDAAQARRTQSTLEAQAGLFEAALSFREAYTMAVLAQAHVDVLTRNQADLDALSRTLQKLAKGGEAAGYDQLRQATSSRLHRQALDSARAAAVAARARLQAWVDGEVTLPPDAVLVLAGRRNDLPGRPLADTAEVQGLEAQAHAGELEARAARRRAVPELSLFAGYRSVAAGGETGHGLSLGLEVPITVFDRGQGDAVRATSDAQLARASAQRLRKRQRAVAHAAELGLGQLETRVGEAQATSLDALSVRAKASELYSAGEASITELLEAHRLAEAAQLAELALLEQVELMRLAQMRATGTMFDAALDRQCRGGLP